MRPTCTRPDERLDGAFGILDFDGDGDFVGVGDLHHGKREEIVFRIIFLLPPFDVEGLPKVTKTVKEPDADEGKAQVGGGLEVIAGEDAEAPGVNRQRFVQPVFRREIGDFGGGFVVEGVPRRRGHVVLEVFEDARHVGEETVIGGGGGEFFLGDQREHAHRIVVGGVPKFRDRRRRKRAAGFVGPEGPEIEGEFGERLQGGRDGGVRRRNGEWWA